MNKQTTSILNAVTSFALVVSVGGCAMVSPATERDYGGIHANVSTFSPYISGLMLKDYNGEIDSGLLGSGKRVRARAWFDYDTQFARYFQEDIDTASAISSNQPGVATLGASAFFSAPPDYNARFVRYFSSASLLVSALSGRWLQAPGLAGFGLLVGTLGDANSQFRRAVDDNWNLRAGSTLSLIHFSEAYSAASMDSELATALKVRRAVVPHAQLGSGMPVIGLGTWGAMRDAKLPMRDVANDEAGRPVAPDGAATRLFSFRIHKHEAMTESPAATLYPKGSTTTVVIPHVYYQDRPDRIRSARELYEKKLANNPALPNGWFAIYTDRNEKGEWKIFVTRKGDERTLVFDIPAKPPG